MDGEVCNVKIPKLSLLLVPTSNLGMILLLPPELIDHICSYLNDADIKVLVKVSSTYYHLLISITAIWKRLFIKNYGATPDVRYSPDQEPREYTLFLSSNEVHYCGMGKIPDAEYKTFTRCITPSRAKQIALGINTNLLIDMFDNVWVWGITRLHPSQLSSSLHQYFPAKIRGIKAKYITSGKTHCAIIDLNGRLYGWGKSREYQLVDTNVTISKPILLYRQKVKRVVCTDKTTILVEDTESEDVYVRGTPLKQFNKIHIPSSIIHPGISPRQCYTIAMLGISETSLPFVCSFKKLSGGIEYSVFIEFNGFATIYHHITTNTIKTDIQAKDVSAGYDHIVILDTLCSVWVYGKNNNYQLGLDHTRDVLDYPVKITNFFATAISAGVKCTAVIGTWLD